MRHSITVKLILAFLAVSVTVVALASGITYWLTVREFKQLVFNQSRDLFVADATLYYQVNGTWDGVLAYFSLRDSPHMPGNPVPQFDPQTMGMGPGLGQMQNHMSVFLLADADGNVLVPAGQYQLDDIVPRAKLSQGTPIEVNGVQVGTVLVLGNPQPLGTLEQQYLVRTNLALLYAALGAAAVALVLGIILARTLTHPLRDLTAAIHAMAKGDLKQHVIVKSRDELGELAAAFNQMSSDLNRLSQARQQMTADIAHDLRTPLTVIGGYIESMRDGVLKPTSERLDTIHGEVQHLQRLVEDLQTLSQADAKELALNCEPVAPSAWLERVAKTYRPLAAQTKVKLAVRAESNLPMINMDADRMAQVFGNLISNALRYSPEGGQIILAAYRQENSIVLSIQDTGSGIAPEALPFIFDRFYQADPARSSGRESGLGLAIAKSIVEAHGGTISAESQVGQGTTMKIQFPI